MADKSDNDLPTNKTTLSRQDEPVETEATDAQAASSQPRTRVPGTNKWQRCKTLLVQHRLVAVLAGVSLVGLLLAAVPWTRYKLAGLVIKRDFTVVVQDKTTHKPVSNATVILAGQNRLTDNNGVARLHVPVGHGQILVQKKYYQDLSQAVLVGFKAGSAPRLNLQATGRQVPLQITNKLTTKPIENVLIKTADTTAKTGRDGSVTLVLPANQTTVLATLSAEGYLPQTVTVKVTDQKDPANYWQLVPAGRIYFLSKRSGKIDVVKTNLDGSDRQVVLAGTGREDERDTILLASRDWKYLVLKSKRDGQNAKLFVIDTASGSATVFDEGQADFRLAGWSGHWFVYNVDRSNTKNWQPKRSALKSYSADTKKIVNLYESTAQGSSDTDYAYSAADNVYVFADHLLFTERWTGSYYNQATLNDKQMSLVSIKPDGTGRQSLKSWPAAFGNYLSLSLSEPQEVYVLASLGGTKQYFEVTGSSIKDAKDLSEDSFSKVYPTFLLSPSGQQTFWADARDGKFALFRGDQAGENKKQLGGLTEYAPYGWFTDDYLLVSKNSSELYITAQDTTDVSKNAVKISDYHKPAFNFDGYGGGYGGL